MKKIDYNNYKTPSDFMKFQLGINVVRIVSSGGLSKKHGMRTSTRWVPLGECTGTRCEFCAKDNDPKLTYTWILLDRGNCEVKLLETGKSIGDQICIISKELKKDPQEIDFEIKRSGMGKETTYLVKVLESKELTEIEKKIITENKQYLINKYLK